MREPGKFTVSQSGEGGEDSLQPPDVNQGTVIIIAGPTASGKTALALRVAEHFKTDIISADSRQCFRELGIAVAKPTQAELEKVKHYFINSHSIHDVVNAQVFEEYALKAAAEIFTRNKYVVMVGGTGLYIKAFCEGLDEIPDVDAAIRQQVIDGYTLKGMEWLQNEVKVNDPVFWATAEQQNPQRLMRALEVKLATGRSIVLFRKNQPLTRPFNILKFGLNLPRPVLYNNINTRVDEMMRKGLLEEVHAMLPYRQINALQTVGYKEMFEYIDGNCTKEQAVEQIKTNTRHYAKRQLTWFNRDADIKWKDTSGAAFDAIISVNS